MTLLPIVVRELRVMARSKWEYVRRLMTALCSVGLWIYIMVVSRSVNIAGGGQAVFNWLSGLGLLYCIILARNTADCISEEKREGTLGLLFLTDLKGYDIALGKLCVNSLRTFYGLLTAIPVVCCALVMGGVTGLEIWRTVLALVNVFFFSHATGLLISTFSRDSRRANGGTALVMVVFFLGIPALVSLLQYEMHSSAAGFLEQLSPAQAYFEAGSVGTRSSNYWQSLGMVHALAWIFLAVASIALPRCWQDKPVKTATKWRARVGQWYFGSPAFRERLRLKLIGINPFLWLVSRNRLGQMAVWGTLAVMDGGWFALWKISDGEAVSLFVVMALMNHAVLKVWVASEAAAHLSEQRRNGALEYLLACTPLSVADILQGQWMGLRRRFLAPVVAVLALDSIFIVWTVNGFTEAQIGSEEKFYFVGYMVAVMAMLIADCVAIGWLAMWRAMMEKKPRTAAGSTLLRVLVLPWLVFGFMAPFGFYISVAAAILIWFMVGIAFDAAFGVNAQANLVARFRELAGVRPDEHHGLFGRVGRMLGKMMR